MFEKTYPELVTYFEKDPYSWEETSEALSESTGLSDEQIEWWFKKRRRKFKITKEKVLFEESHPELMTEFEKNPRLEPEVRRSLAESTGLSELQIYNWFHSRRKKNLKS